MQLLAIFAMVVGLGSVMFALQNNVPVTVVFLAWRFDGSLALVLLLAMALGALIVALLSTPATLRRQWAGRRQDKRINELEKERKDLQTELDAVRSRLPTTPEDEGSERPYVGLRQLLAGNEPAPGSEPPSR